MSLSKSISEPLKNTKSLLQRFFAVPLEIRAIKEGERVNKVYSTVRNDWQTAWDATYKSIANQNKTSNVFITLNPIKKDVAEAVTAKNGSLKAAGKGMSTKDADIEAYRWLLIDLDPVRKDVPSQSVSSTAAEKAKAWVTGGAIFAFMKEKGFFDPVICDSGNGYHLHYRINLENNEENKALVKRFLAILSQKFSSEDVKIDTSVFNPARIIKMYGTMARKGENNPESGRIHRKSAFLNFPDMAELRVNDKTTLEAVAGAVKIEDRQESVACPEKQQERVDWVRNFLTDHEISFWEEVDHGDVKFFFEEGCPFDPTHRKKDAYLCVFKDGKSIFKCLHDSCADHHWADFIRLFEPEYMTAEEKATQAADGVLSLLGEQASDEEVEEKEAETPKKVSLERDSKGRIMQTMTNYLTAMREDAMLKDMFGFNVYTQLPENMKTRAAWTDVDDAKVFTYLEAKYGLTSWDKTLRALSIRLDECSFNPVTDKLDKLVWDGKNRLHTCLIDFLDADDSEYTRAVAEMLFVGAVARAYDAGCKFDNMVVLIGPQGCGKSTFAKQMALDDAFFTDSIRGIGDKEGSEQLLGSWIVEWGEMSAMRRAKDAESIKLFIAQQYDKYRPSYGRRVLVYPRRCIFIGTTNDESFLTDKTGNRRFFPVQVNRGRLNIWAEESRAYFEQVMAEAVHMYKEGCRPHMPENLADEIRGRQEVCVEEDYREGLIDLWLESNPDVELVCTKMIWDNALGNSDRDITRTDARVVGRILSNSKFLEKRGAVRFEKWGVQKAWIRKKNN